MIAEATTYVLDPTRSGAVGERVIGADSGLPVGISERGKVEQYSEFMCCKAININVLCLTNEIFVV